MKGEMRMDHVQLKLIEFEPAGAPFSIGEAAAGCKDVAAKRCQKMWNSVVQAESPFEIKVSLFYFNDVFEENRSVGGDYTDAKIIDEDCGASSKRA